MRNLLLAGVLLFATSASSEAAPCLPDTLANYKTLGSGGCTLGNVTFANFDSFLLDPLAVEINAATVVVTPFGRGFSFAFDIAPSTTFYDVTIYYTATVKGLLGGNQLSMTGSSATGDGIVTAVENKCVGGFFLPLLPDPSACDSGEAVTLIAIQDEVVNSLPFTPSSFFDVFAEIAIDPGVAGTAGLQGSVSTTFSTHGVPEPMTILLVSTGLAAVQFRRRRGEN